MFEFKFADKLHEWYSNQSYGFVYSEERCGYRLSNKVVNADSRDEIVEYFTSMVPLISVEVEKALNA